MPLAPLQNKRYVYHAGPQSHRRNKPVVVVLYEQVAAEKALKELTE